MRIPKIVAGTTRRRRLQGGSSGVDLDVNIEEEDLCAEVTCGLRSECWEGGCACADGWETPPQCIEGDCLCSRQAGCSTDCDGCHTNGTCIGCADEGAILLDGACRNTCPAGLLAVATPLGGTTCAPCHESCGGACFGPAQDQCLVCDPIGVNAFLSHGACVLRCPEAGYYADRERVCHPCSPLCRTCRGPRSTDCTSCTANSCSLRGGCPEGVVFPSLDVRAAANYTFAMSDGTNFVAESTAVVQITCPFVRERDNITRQWGFQSFTGQGVAATAESTHRRRVAAANAGLLNRYGHNDMGLLQQYFGANPMGLINCNIRSVGVGAAAAITEQLSGEAEWTTGNIKAVDKTRAVGRCVSNCPHGQYTDADGECRKCHSACRRCSGPSDVQCVDPTPRSPFVEADCSPGATRMGNRCARSCSAGSFALPGGQCADCTNYDCEMCDAADPTRCLTCKPLPWIRSVLKPDGQCHERCASGEFLASTGLCTACDATCASCDGPGSRACTGCDSGGHLRIFHGQCIAACPAGFASGPRPGDGCQPCHQTCGECDAPGEATACTTCTTAARLFMPRNASIGSCRSRCLAGEYGSGGTCVACEEGCTRCRATGACTACTEGLVLRDGRCGPPSGAVRRFKNETTNQLFGIANRTKSLASAGELDMGYTVGSILMETPTVPVAQGPAVDLTGSPVYERQRIVIVGNSPVAPTPPTPPAVPGSQSPPPSSCPTPPPGNPSPPPPLAPPPLPPYPPPSPDTPLAGDLLLTFNGETSEGIDLAAVAQHALGYTADGDEESAADIFAHALVQLSSIASSINSDPPLNVTLSASLNASDSTVRLVVEIAFHPHALVSSPLNLGSLPLIALDVNGLAGVRNTHVFALQKGAARPNGTYPEQTASLGCSADTLADLVGGITLSFRNSTTVPLAPNASATVVREALQALDVIGEIEVFRVELSGADGAFAGLQWTIRFYDAGYPAHVGPQPSLLLDPSGLSLASHGGTRRSRQLQSLSLAELGITVGVEVTVAGENPDTSDTSDDGLRATVVHEDVGGNTTVITAEAIAYVPVVHICGNGVRSSAEYCDDSNTQGGDGCDALCLPEPYFTCVSSTGSFGSGVGGLDTCAPTCGDGRRISWSNHPEACDDNNTANGDGCDASCQVEIGFECTGGSITATDT